MRIGDYVRTKKKVFQPPQIARIVNISKDSGYKNQYFIELDHNLLPDMEYKIYEEDIDKSSPNLIDLIEVGYYVNDERITRVITEDICGDEVLDHQHIFIEDKEIYKEDIETVVTKEQFEIIKYRVVNRMNKEEIINDINKLEENFFLQNKINKAIKLLEEDYFEDGSGYNVEEVLKILRGEENESN